MSALPYPAYRALGVEWLENVPSDWKDVPLRTLFKRVKRTGFVDEALLSVYRDYGVIDKSTRSDNFNNPSEDLSVYQLVCPGDLAINKMKAWQGSVAISNIRGIVSPAYFIFRPTHDSFDQYLHYLFRSNEYVSAYALVSKGVRINQWDLAPEQHASMKVILPSYEEQRGIAAYLDRETGQIDELITKQEQLVATLTERRQAVITQAVTRGLDPDVVFRHSGKVGIGLLPDHWKSSKMSMLFDLIGSGTTPPSDGSDLYGGDIPWVTTGELRENVICETRKYVTAVAVNSLSALKIYPAGSLLIAMYGATIGRLGILGVAATTNQACSVMANPRGVETEFVYFALQSARERIILMASGGGQPNINQDVVRNLVIAVPPIAEQVQIVRFLSNETEKVDALVTKARGVVSLLRERRQALISAAVTGKIDVRGL